MKDLGSSGFEIKVEEEQSVDVETGHVAESVAYAAFDLGPISDAAESVIGEAGMISTDQGSGAQWHTTFAHTPSQRKW